MGVLAGVLRSRSLQRDAQIAELKQIPDIHLGLHREPILAGWLPGWLKSWYPERFYQDYLVSLHVHDAEELRRVLAVYPCDRLYTLEISSKTGEPVTDADLAELPDMPELNSLRIYDTQITDESVSRISQFTNLKQLDLHHNPLMKGTTFHQLVALQQLNRLTTEHTLPEDDVWTVVCQLPKLASWKVHNADYRFTLTDKHMEQLSQPLVLASVPPLKLDITEASADKFLFLQSLQSLDLSGTEITAGVRELLTHLKLLTVLDLRQSTFDDNDAVALAQLDQLTSLRLSHTRITDECFQHLSDLSQLTSLEIAGCKITGGKLNQLKSSSELRYLDLSSCPLTIKGLSQLEAFGNLTLLLLSNIGDITGEVIRHLKLPKNNVDLRLNDNRLDKDTFAALSEVEGIHRLDLQNCTFPPADLSALGPQSNCSQLNLSGTPVSKAGLSGIAQMTRLELVFLDRCHIPDDLLGDDTLPSSLRYLLLRDSSLTDAGLQYLAESSIAKNIHQLAVTGTRVRLQDVPSFSSFKNLYTFEADNTRLAPDALKHISALPSLEAMSLRQTPIPESEIDDFKTRHPGCTVYYTESHSDSGDHTD